MRPLLYFSLAIISLPCLLIITLVISSWREGVRAHEITELVELSGLSLTDDYFCYEAKCFGTFLLSDDKEVNFFIVRDIAEKVVSQSQALNNNWDLANQFCNRVFEKDSKYICQIGGKIMSHEEYLNEQALISSKTP